MSDSHRWLWLAAFVAFLVVQLGGPARASDPTEDDLVHKGVEARKRQDDAAALQLFTQAYALHHSPRAAAQMGLAEIALGRWLDAEAHLREAMGATGDAWIRKNTQTLNESLARVRQEVGTLEILGSPRGAEVVIGGEVRGTLPLAQPIHVRAGEVHVELRANGYQTESRALRVAPDQLTRETVTLALLPPVTAGRSPNPTPSIVATSPLPREPSSDTPARSAAGVPRLVAGVLVAGGAVAAGAGLVFGLKARSAGQTDSQSQMFDRNADQTGHRYETLQWIGYGAGAALVVGGIVTYLLGGRGGEVAGTTTSVSLQVLPNGGVGLIGWRL